MKVRELYSSTSGALTVNDELEIIANDLLRISDQFKRSTHSETDIRNLSMDELALEAVARNYSSLGQDLLTLLDSLKVQGTQRQWKSIHQAFKTV